MSEHEQFSVNKIFWTLLILTAVEGAWGKWIPYDRKWLLWGGLLIFAFWKGLLIYMYFMHMKFEGWIVKGLIAPTPVLIAVLIFALMPDVSFNDELIHGVADQLSSSKPSAAAIRSGLLR